MGIKREDWGCKLVLMELVPVKAGNEE